MTTWPILSVVTFLPVVGAFLMYISRGDDEAARRNSRWIALTSLIVRRQNSGVTGVSRASVL